MENKWNISRNNKLRIKLFMISLCSIKFLGPSVNDIQKIKLNAYLSLSLSHCLCLFGLHDSLKVRHTQSNSLTNIHICTNFFQCRYTLVYQYHTILHCIGTLFFFLPMGPF
uniref:Uncharacterized protein n=1 Tax=Cacopsylla melanoneura TaxID=428564 RepID=A0A8D8TU61_9HEMI